MNRKQKIIVSVTGIFLVALILMGLTYAYFLTQIKGNTNDKSISVTTANLALEYMDGTPDILTKDKIVPNTVVGTKSFDVINTGDSLVENFAVVLDNVKITYAETQGENIKDSVTTLNRSEDFEIEVVCHKGLTDGSSDLGVIEYTTVMSGTNQVLFTSSLDAGELLECYLTLTYKEAGVDQSKDMNKKIEARINIMDSKDTIDIAGKVNDASSGDYVEAEEVDLAYSDGDNSIKLLGSKNKKKVTSYIAKDGNYKLVGLEPGDYKISVYNTSAPTTPKLSTNITIKKGNEGKVDITNNVITISDNSRMVTLDTNSGSFVLNTNIKNLKNYIKDAIIESAKKAKSENSTSRTIFYDKSETLPSTPGINVNTSNERVLGMTPDNYTSLTGEYSYFFRGAVKDNYLEFNNMCWRIVRVEGDGSIKIILAAEKKCSEITASDTNSAIIGNGNYGYDFVDVGDLDGNGVQEQVAVSDVENGDLIDAFDVFINGGNFESIIPSNWTYETKTYSGWEYEFKNLIKSQKICVGDHAKIYDFQGNQITSDNFDASSFNRDDNYVAHENYIRVSKNKNITLMCNENQLTKEAYQAYPITIDEALLAGVYLSDENNSYYNVTASPSSSRLFLNEDGTMYPDVYTFEGSGYMIDIHMEDFRPAISLIPGMELANDSGDGTITSPYKVKVN